METAMSAPERTPEGQTGREPVMIHRVIIDFAVPVDLDGEAQRTLYNLVSRLAKEHQPDGCVHWLFGMGAMFNEASIWDDSGPLEFDDSVFHVTTQCRERHDETV